MAAASDPDEPDWLGACRRAATAIRAMLAERPTIAERVKETGTRGEGGDRTLLIDEAAEDVVFAELEAIASAGARFTAISEERGVVDFGSDKLLVVDRPDRRLDQREARPSALRALDRGRRRPDDGRRLLRLRAGLRPAGGVGRAPRRGRHARRGPARPDARRAAHARTASSRCSGVESADPRWVVQSADALAEAAHRLRAIGAIAVSLCQVAAARFDAMASLKRCRAVDAAAAQLIVREAGGHVAFIAYDDPLAAPLDLEPRSPVIAARTREGLAQAATVPVWP